MRSTCSTNGTWFKERTSRSLDRTFVPFQPWSHIIPPTKLLIIKQLALSKIVLFDVSPTRCVCVISSNTSSSVSRGPEACCARQRTGDTQPSPEAAQPSASPIWLGQYRPALLQQTKSGYIDQQYNNNNLRVLNLLWDTFENNQFCSLDSWTFAKFETFQKSRHSVDEDLKLNLLKSMNTEKSTEISNMHEIIEILHRNVRQTDTKELQVIPSNISPYWQLKWISFEVWVSRSIQPDVFWTSFQISWWSTSSHLRWGKSSVETLTTFIVPLCYCRLSLLPHYLHLRVRYLPLHILRFLLADRSPQANARWTGERPYHCFFFLSKVLFFIVFLYCFFKLTV